MFCLALGPQKAAFPAEPGRERRPVRRSYGSLVRNLVVRGLLLSDDALRCETGVVMVVYLHEALERRLASGQPLTLESILDAVIEGAAHRLRPKLMTVTAVLASLVPILWESGIGSDVMKPIAAPIVGGIFRSQGGHKSSIW